MFFKLLSEKNKLWKQMQKKGRKINKNCGYEIENTATLSTQQPKSVAIKGFQRVAVPKNTTTPTTTHCHPINEERRKRLWQNIRHLKS